MDNNFSSYLCQWTLEESSITISLAQGNSHEDARTNVQI